MTRKILICVGFLAIAAGLALSSSNNVKEREDRLTALNREIAGEQDRIRILTAEWHTLRAPERIEVLASRHLTDLQPSTPTQIATLSALLDPLPAADPAASSAEVTPPPVSAAAPRDHAAVTAPIHPAAPPVARPARSQVAADHQARPGRRTTPTSADVPARRSAPSSIEEIIAASENPFRAAVSAEQPAPPTRNSDELSELIERQPSDGVVWASAESR